MDKKRKTIVKQFDVIQIDLDNDLEEDFELIYDISVKEKMSLNIIIGISILI